MVEELLALLSHLNSEENDMALAFVEKVRKAEEDVEFLNALRACGVDNWDGYSDAVEMLEGEEE